MSFDDAMNSMLDAMGFAPHQSEPCGRPTSRGTLCPRSRNAMSARFREHVFTSPACKSHLTAEEHAQRQSILDMEEAAQMVAEPACWSWPIPEGDYTDAPERLLSGFQQGRCAICGEESEGLVEDHDHYSGFTRAWLCRGCNTMEGISHMPIFDKYRDRHPASILGIELIYYGPFWEYERDSGKFRSPRPEDQDPWENCTASRLGL